MLPQSGSVGAVGAVVRAEGQGGVAASRGISEEWNYVAFEVSVLSAALSCVFLFRDSNDSETGRGPGAGRGRGSFLSGTPRPAEPQQPLASRRGARPGWAPSGSRALPDSSC